MYFRVLDYLCLTALTIIYFQKTVTKMFSAKNVLQKFKQDPSKIPVIELLAFSYTKMNPLASLFNNYSYAITGNFFP